MIDRIGTVLLLGAALAVAPCPGGAETYRWVDEQGNVTYSDRPPQPAETRAPTIEVRPAPDVKAPEVKAPEVQALEPKTSDGQTPATRARDARMSVPPAPIARTGPTKLDELLELSGIRAQLVGLLSRVAGELRPAPGQMSASDQAAVDRILGQSLRHEAVYAGVRDSFRPLVDRTDLEATAAWLRTPAARKIVALEIASSEPGAEQKVADHAAGLKANPPAARRLELLQRLDWVTAANETSADLVAAIARGVSTAVAAAGPPEQRLRPGQIEDRAAQVRARVNETLREARMMSMLYTYRPLEDEELSEYVRFSGSEAGRWYNTAMRKALVSALGKTVEQTAAALVRAVPLERWARTATP